MPLLTSPVFQQPSTLYRPPFTSQLEPTPLALAANTALAVPLLKNIYSATFLSAIFEPSLDHQWVSFNPDATFRHTLARPKSVHDAQSRFFKHPQRCFLLNPTGIWTRFLCDPHNLTLSWNHFSGNAFSQILLSHR